MKIGRYEILDEIGQGAMGTVYRARDPLIERTVAIKAVPIVQLRQENKEAESRFLREAQSAGRLSHPNIVTIYDVGETDTLAYIAMEFLPGATLRDIMDRGPMPLDLALDTATQMAEALAFAHEHGVIHRDVKPANVVVTGQHGRIKLTDFGIAHLANADYTHTGQMLGSPRYMSPEQARGNELDGRSDVFSLGAVLYEMLTGRYAFDGDNLAAIVYRVVNEMPAPAPTLRPAIPAGLAGLLAHMLSKNPHARPDARTVAQALHALAPAAPPPPPGRAGVSWPLRVVAFGAPIGVLIVIGMALIIIEHFVPPPRHAAVLPPPPRIAAPAAAPGPAPAPAAAPNGTPAPQASTTPRASPAAVAEKDAYLAGLDAKAVELRIRRAELLLKYTRVHPDVVQVDRELERLDAERRRYLRQLRKNREN